MKVENYPGYVRSEKIRIDTCSVMGECQPTYWEQGIHYRYDGVRFREARHHSYSLVCDLRPTVRIPTNVRVV